MSGPELLESVPRPGSEVFRLPPADGAAFPPSIPLDQGPDDFVFNSGSRLTEIARIVALKGDLQQKTLQALAIAQVVEDNYALGGRLKEIRSLTGGVINDSYLLTVDHPQGERQYFARHYAAGKKQAWVEFEHALLAHLDRPDFPWSARLITTKQGATFVRTTPEQAEQPRYLMLTTALTGESPYSHENNTLSQSELLSVAHVFARFHNIASTVSTSQYDPEYLPTEARMLRKFYGKRFEELQQTSHRLKELDTPFAQTLTEGIATAQEALLNARVRLSDGLYRQLPHIPIHHDLHPGNCKFSGGEVSGVFDLDFAKVDARVYDLATSLVFFVTRFCDHPKETGTIDFSKMGDFLRAYQAPINFPERRGIGSLTAKEALVLPDMMVLAAGGLVHWFVDDYCNRFDQGGWEAIASIEDEYTKCLRFRLGAVIDAEREREKITKLALGYCSDGVQV